MCIRDRMSRQHTCQKDFSNHKQGIKTYCVIRFTKRYLRFFLFLLILLFSSSLIVNKYIYIMLIMSSLCPSLHFFTKRNDKEEEKNVKRRNIHRNISACRIAMIMKFSTHSCHYICFLCKPF